MQKTRTKFGNFMFIYISRMAFWVATHKVLFFLLSFTWGILGTLIGYIMYGFCLIFLRNKIKERGKFYTAHYLVLGNRWGGMECGIDFIVADNMGANSTFNTMCHELGHTYQNAVLGPFVIFLGFIPSVIRYWYQTIRDRKGKPNVDYDLFWYEGSATYIGKKLVFFNYIKRDETDIHTI